LIAAALESKACQQSKRFLKAQKLTDFALGSDFLPVRAKNQRETRVAGSDKDAHFKKKQGVWAFKTMLLA
jgi:hypothetical protein